MTFPLSHPLTLLPPSFLPSQEPSWLNVPNSLVAPGEKRQGSLARVFRKVRATCCSSPSVAVSGCQHEVLSNQEPTAPTLDILIPVLKIGHVGAGVGLGFMAPDDLP